MNTDWMMPDEIFSWLEENLELGAAILEFGSGHGSIRLAESFELVSIVAYIRCFPGCGGSPA